MKSSVFKPRIPRSVALSYLLALLLAGCAQQGLFSSIRTFSIWNESIQTGEIHEASNEILLIVDNSESMEEEIAALRSSLSGFVQTLNNSGIKYRLHFTSLSRSYINIQGHGSDSPCWDPEHPEKLCLNGDAVETATFPNPTLYQLQDLVTFPFDYEAGVAVAASAIDKVFKRQNGNTVQPTHVVILSDEDNEYQIEGKTLELEAGRSDYSYQYSRPTDSWKSFITHNVCLRTPNTHGTVAGNFSQQYYCSDSRGFGGHGDPGAQDTHFACEAPKFYRCSEVADGVMTSKLSANYHSGCTIDSSQPIVRRLIAKDASWPGVSDCQPLSCQIEWYLPYELNPLGDAVTITEKGCSAGFEVVKSSFEREVGRVAEHVWQTGSLPEGVTRKINYLRVNETLSESDWLSLDEAYEKLKTLYPNYANQIDIYSFPENPSDLRPAKLARSSGLREFMAEHYPSLKFTFNAIVSLNNGACPGGTHQNVRGTEYLRLADETGGVKGDICNPDFTEFMSLLAANVEKQNLPSYQLNNVVMPGTYVQIENASTGRILVQGRDFEVIGGRYIRFFEGVITESNQTLNVSIKELGT